MVAAIPIAVRIVCSDVLRDGTAPRKSAAFSAGRLDWLGRFEAYDHLGDFRPLRPWRPEATQMASRRFRRLRRGFLCVPVSGHGMGEPDGGERGKISGGFAPGDRSEERRVGKDGRPWRSPLHDSK